MVPFTKEGGEIYLAFAAELGIRVTSSREVSLELAGLRMAGALLEVTHAELTRTTYRLENTLAIAQAITIEHPILVGAELVETPAPVTETADWYRWRVSCPARTATTFQVVERRFSLRSEQLLDQTYEGLQRYLRGRWLDSVVLARIKTLLDERQAIARNGEAIGTLQAEREEIYAREDQLRKNMAALSTSGEEGTLRQEVVAQLQGCEARLTAIETRIGELKQDNLSRQATIAAELASFQAGEGSPA